MRFPIDADMPRSLADVVRRRGHEAVDVRDIGLGGAKDSAIAGHARAGGFCLITGDFDFANIRNYPPAQYAGIVVVVVPRVGTAGFINRMIDAFLAQDELIRRISGRLAIVEPGRTRMRT